MVSRTSSLIRRLFLLRWLMKKFLFALIFVFPFFFKLDSFASIPFNEPLYLRDSSDSYTIHNALPSNLDSSFLSTLNSHGLTLSDIAIFISDVTPSGTSVFYFCTFSQFNNSLDSMSHGRSAITWRPSYYASFYTSENTNIVFRTSRYYYLSSNHSLSLASTYLQLPSDSVSGSYVFISPFIASYFGVIAPYDADIFKNWLLNGDDPSPSVSYDSSIKTLAFWHNSFSLLNDTWCTLSWSFPGVIKSKDYSAIYIDLFVNGSQVDSLHKGYPDLWDGALLDSTIFKYSDYGIKSGDTVKAVLTPYIGSKYGDDVIIEWKVPLGSHGGGGASRTDTTIDVPTNTPPSPTGTKPITTVITPEPIKVVLPSGETPTETTTVAPNGDTVTYQYDVTNNQYYYEYPYYVQNYYIDYSVPSIDSPDYTEEFQRIETYMNQVIAILTHIANTPPAPTPSGDTYYNNVSSGDTITNITNNYTYNYNLNFDFDFTVDNAKDDFDNGIDSVKDWVSKLLDYVSPLNQISFFSILFVTFSSVLTVVIGFALVMLLIKIGKAIVGALL